MNRRLVVAFLLALLLPLAQLAAAAHEVSHVRAEKAAPASIHCDLCAVAAAVSGGAATASAPVIAHAPVLTGAPAQVEAIAPRAERVALFLSRAPPVLR